MWNLLKGLIVCSLIILPMCSDPWCKPKEAVFICLGMCFIAVSWLSNRSYRCTFNNKWLSMIFIYVSILFGWHFLRPIVFDVDGQILYNYWTLLPSLNVFIALMMIYSLVEYTDNQDRWVDLAKFICGVSLFLACYSILQWFGCAQFVNIAEVKEYKMVTFFGNTALNAGYLAVTLPLFFIFKNWLRWAGIILIFISCILARCHTATVANIYSLIAMYFFTVGLSRRRDKFLLAVVILLPLAITANYYSDIVVMLKGRPQMWSEVLLRVKGSCLFGFGLGSFPRDFANLNLIKIGSSPLRWPSSHSLLFDTLYETGLVLIVLVAGYLFSLFKKIRELEKSITLSCYMTGLIAFIIVSSGVYIHRIAPIALIGVIYIGALEAFTSNIRRA